MHNLDKAFKHTGYSAIRVAESKSENTGISVGEFNTDRSRDLPQRTDEPGLMQACSPDLRMFPSNPKFLARPRLT